MAYMGDYIDRVGMDLMMALNEAIARGDREMTALFASVAAPYLQVTSVGYTSRQFEWWNPLLEAVIEATRMVSPAEVPSWMRDEYEYAVRMARERLI